MVIGENTMKTIAYKKTENGKVEKINPVKVIDNETALLDKYETLFNKIDKGSPVLSFVRTKENQHGLMDCLQSVMVKILAEKNLEDIKDVSAYFNKMFSDRYKDQIRTESRYEIFKTDNLDHVIESRENGITQDYINECLTAIKGLLTVSEYKLFTLYHVKGYRQNEIAVKLDTYPMVINRKVKNLNNKLETLKINYLYENRYVAYQSQGKKRQHKRSVLTEKQIKELSGKTYHVAIENYQESKRLIPKGLDQSKLPYSKAHGLKDIQLDKSSYMVIANGNFAYNEKVEIIQNVKQDSDIIHNENKANYKLANNYRVKRVKRIRDRKIWSQHTKAMELNKVKDQKFWEVYNVYTFED